MRGPARVLVAVLAVAVVATAVAPPAAPAAAQESPRPDPDRDRIGWEDGYWHDDPISVDQSDGLSDAELERYVARATARVEYLREAEFDADVPVSVIDRESYRNRTERGGAGGDAYGAWNNQVWEALFVTGEDTDVQSELGTTYGSSVAGFYSPADDEIKIITDDPDAPTIDNATLMHELVHALQDQRYNLSAERFGGETQDEQLATDGVVEGEANYIEALYRQRCAAGEWECVATPPQGGGGESGDGPNLAILLTLLQPYSDGPVYVAERYDEGGWDAVDAALADPPTTTEQVIHVTDETPSPVEFTDRARNGWRTFPGQGLDGADVAGEASMFVMFWNQARTADARTLDPSVLGRTDGEFDQYNYDAPPSNGWDGDRIVPYRHPAGEDEYGYVWVTQWDSERDAREFREAYLAILDAHDARTADDGVRVIPDGPFADAFLVSQNGTRVVVVNGPEPADVRDIRPGLDPVEASGGGVSGVTAPGFGVAAAVAALLGAALVARRRR
jgi:PGF-CTERM protein